MPKEPRTSRSPALPTMQLLAVDWLLAGSTVALGIVLLAAPFALTRELSSLYTLQGTPVSTSLLSRLMMSSWCPPLLAAGPLAVAIACTVTAMRPRRRRAILIVTLITTVGFAVLFLQGLLGPIVRAASGAG